MNKTKFLNESYIHTQVCLYSDCLIYKPWYNFSNFVSQNVRHILFFVRHVWLSNFILILSYQNSANSQYGLILHFIYKYYVKIYTGSMSILRINIVFFGPNMAASQLPWIFWILKGWYLQNEKVLEAQILTGLYWYYIFSIGNVNWHI